MEAAVCSIYGFLSIYNLSPPRRFSNSCRFPCTKAALFSAHNDSSSIGFSSECPVSVRRYSTRGGTSGKTVRSTIPAFSNSRRCLVNSRCEIPSNFFCNCPKRIVLFSACSKICKIFTDHLWAISCNVRKIGQFFDIKTLLILTVLFYILTCKIKSYIYKYPLLYNSN